MRSPASKMHPDVPTRISVGAGIVAMGLLALFAWSTLPQPPPEVLRLPKPPSPSTRRRTSGTPTPR
ncbi:MAG: hypothetical protein M3N38_06115 [Pseudomonadota bacterium]|nr:hypothetical protein [Pseudomonadota bacterium]